MATPLLMSVKASAMLLAAVSVNLIGVAMSIADPSTIVSNGIVLLNTLFLYSIHQKSKKNAENIQKVEVATNSIKDALIASEKVVSFKEGMEAQKLISAKELLAQQLIDAAALLKKQQEDAAKLLVKEEPPKV